MSGEPTIIAAAETPYTRHPSPELTTPAVLADAARRALGDAGLAPAAIDGLGVASFTLAPDHAIDLAVQLGLRVSWLMDASTGGAAGIDMLQHALRAVAAGDASRILLLAGDVFRAGAFAQLVDGYNVATREHLAPIPFGGPNALFALLTQRHMAAHGLTRADYGRLAVAQRGWAAENPGAVYRAPLTIEDYLAAPIVAAPLGMLDCVPVVSGADALIVAAEGSGVRVRALRVAHNADQHDGDGLQTGLSALAARLWSDAAARPSDIDVVSVYDDYPAMALIQLADLGFGSPRETLATIETRALAVNTSGGQLSAGQAGAGAGMHGLVEVATQLRGRAGERQVAGARLGVASGYGMVAYRHGACANAVVLEAP